MRWGIRSAALTAVGVASLIAACGNGGSQATTGCPGSTLRCTLLDARDVGALDPGPGEPLVQRRDLAPAAAVARTLVTFAQISDAHVTDAESPLRVEAIDPFGRHGLLGVPAAGGTDDPGPGRQRGRA